MELNGLQEALATEVNNSEYGAESIKVLNGKIPT